VAAQADAGVPCGALRAPPERERRDPSPSPPFQGPSFQDDLQNDLQDEVRWLRLFHRFSRTLRLFEEKSALLKEIVSAAREELDAQAAGIFYRGDGQPLAILAGRTGTRFEDLISMAAASAREAGSLKISFGGAAGSAGAPGGQGEKGCMILFGLSPGSLRAAGPMVPDVQDLLGRIGSPARP
jgi:hypothetical protein